MSSSPFAATAAAGFFVEGALTLAHREFSFAGAGYDHLLDAAYAVAMVGCAGAVGSVARRVAAPRFARIAARVASAGFGAMAVESAVGAVHRLDALGPLFTLGIAAAVLGCLVLAFGGRRAPRWIAALPLAAMVIAAAGGEIGASLVSAGVWAVLTRVLRDAEHAATGRAVVPEPSSAPS